MVLNNVNKKKTNKKKNQSSHSIVAFRFSQSDRERRSKTVSLLADNPSNVGDSDPLEPPLELPLELL